MIGEFIEISNDSRIKVSAGINGIDLGTQKNLFKYKANIVVANQDYVKIEGEIKDKNFELNVLINNESFVIKLFEQRSTFDQFQAIGELIKNTKNNGAKGFANTISPKFFDGNNNQISDNYSYDCREYKKFAVEKITINGNGLKIFEVPLRSAGLSICVYNEYDELIGVSIKSGTVKNGKSTCTLYAANEKWFKYLSLVTISWLKMKDYKDGYVGDYKNEIINTFYQDQINKYDPKFIEQVINKVGLSNLPENMELVNEEKRKAQNTFGIWINRIILGIVFIPFIILITYVIFFAK